MALINSDVEAAKLIVKKHRKLVEHFDNVSPGVCLSRVDMDNNLSYWELSAH